MSATAETTLTYRQLFSVGGFFRLASSALLARAASQMWQVTLVLFALASFHSPVLAGAVVFLSIAPGLLLSPIEGALLDRHGRGRLILLDYGLAAVLAGALVVLLVAGTLTPQLLLILVALSSLTRPLSFAGTRSFFPLLVPPRLWDRANAVDSGSEALAAVLGPALAGVLLGWAGAPWAFMATAVMFGLATVALVGIREPATKTQPGDRLLPAAWAAVLYVVRHPTLRGVMFTLWLNNIAYGVLTVALPVLVLHALHGTADAVGGLWAVMGFATVATGLTVGRLSTRGRERTIVAWTSVVFALALALIAVWQSAAGLIICMGLMGVSFGAADVSLFSIRQRRTDPLWFGRAFAVAMALNFFAMPVGSVLAGPAVQQSLTLTILLAALAALVGGGVALLTIPKEGRER